jgi:hypothetical protein
MTAPKLGLSDEFNMLFGTFFGAWASAELTIDYAIYKLMKISRPQAHHMLAGIEIGRKMRLLEALLRRSTIDNKSELLGHLHKMQNESLRNVFAHSFMHSDEHSVTFVNRKFGQRYEAYAYTFGLIRFRMHVQEFLSTGRQFYDGLHIDLDDLQKFAEAALRASRSSRRSPKPPRSRA